MIAIIYEMPTMCQVWYWAFYTHYPNLSNNSQLGGLAHLTGISLKQLNDSSEGP